MCILKNGRGIGDMKACIFYLLSFIFGVINPYFGIFSILSIFELFIIAAFLHNGKTWDEVSRFVRGSDAVREIDLCKKRSKALLRACAFLAIAGALLYAFDCAVIWFMTVRVYDGAVICLPSDIVGIGKSVELCLLLLVISLTFCLIGAILTVKETRSIISRAQDVPYKDRVVDVSFDVKKTTLLAITLCMVLCLVCDSISWFGACLNMLFPLYIVMIKNAIRIWLKRNKANGLTAAKTEYFLDGLDKNGHCNRTFIGVCWIVAISIVLCEAGLLLAESGILQNSMQFSSIMLSAAVILMECITAALLSKDIKSMIVRRDNYEHTG